MALRFSGSKNSKFLCDFLPHSPYHELLTSLLQISKRVPLMVHMPNPDDNGDVFVQRHHFIDVCERKKHDEISL
jgi:hypothetical protein